MQTYLTRDHPQIDQRFHQLRPHQQTLWIGSASWYYSASSALPFAIHHPHPLLVRSRDHDRFDVAYSFAIHHLISTEISPSSWIPRCFDSFSSRIEKVWTDRRLLRLRRSFLVDWHDFDWFGVVSSYDYCQPRLRQALHRSILHRFHLSFQRIAPQIASAIGRNDLGLSSDAWMRWFLGRVWFLGPLFALMRYALTFLELHRFCELMNYHSRLDLCLVFSYRCFESISCADCQA